MVIDFSVSYILVSETLFPTKTIELGFRSIELIQDLVDENQPQKGRTFYFNVNDVPIFLKGGIVF
jgi:hypothetical protein